MNPNKHSKYRTIYADPPWPEYGGGKIKRGADPRMAHSTKPDEMRCIIEKVSYAPRPELFARRKTASWDVWGNEVASDVKMAA